MDQTIRQRAELWTKPPYDEKTRLAAQALLNGDEAECADAFYRDLEFGTGGLRGILGVGTNRMNVYVVALATQGFANYLTKQCAAENLQQCVAVSYDCRNGSSEFALTTAKVFAANGFKVYLFTAMRPTPVLSFAVRHYGCCGGVIVTASHNPKEYNGYKAYGKDGGQLVAPHDRNVMAEVAAIKGLSEVRMQGGEANIRYVDEEVDTAYLEKVCALSLDREAVRKQKDLKIVYTPLHGTGMTMVPRALKRWGFENVLCVPEQMVPDGNFSTVASPNPEEKAAMQPALDLARREKADLVIATDPDADRVGVAIADGRGDFILLNGNQTGSVLVNYLLRKWKENGRLTGKEYIVKTIVTTELLKEMAAKNGLDCPDVLTGFKYIAEVIGQREGKQTFIGGGEESYGYLAGEFVRDKDAVIACCLIAEMAAEAACKGESFMDILCGLYKEYGFYRESLVSLSRKGQSGAEEIKAMMADFRQNPPRSIGGEKVVEVRDYKQGFAGLPPSDVLQFFTEKGSKITVRPSGTEPKIKFYFGLKCPWQDGKGYAAQDAEAALQVEKMKKDLGI
ncbi:MAG: phospho-sugar mutase [Bacteroides sp.]|nr:phospho-sugar mutase [Ruminococcus flavefaciens]MCM1555602.1 phospho-sugar mutase [Bacteroides sp.]